jgi:hypothetical protein
MPKPLINPANHKLGTHFYPVLLYDVLPIAKFRANLLS